MDPATPASRLNPDHLSRANYLNAFRGSSPDSDSLKRPTPKVMDPTAPLSKLDSEYFSRANIQKAFKMASTDSASLNLSTPNVSTLKLSEWNWNLVNPIYKKPIKLAIFTTLSAIGAITTPWKEPRIWGATVLTTVAYGIINDLFACRVCPEYFTVRHRYEGQSTENRFVKTLDPNLNALVWGMMVTHIPAAIGGCILSGAASKSGTDEKVVIKSLVCYAALALVIADRISRFAKAKFEKKPNDWYPTVPHEMQPRWHANNIRNLTGYVLLGAYALLSPMMHKLAGNE